VLDENCPEVLATIASRKQRILLKDEDTKARLVKLCINNFQDYVDTKKKDEFFSRIKCRFEMETGLDVDVKGYMYRWAKARRKVAEEEKMKSGVARSYGEFDLALDSWISMLDDVAATTDAERKTKKEEESQREEEVGKVRASMRMTFAERRKGGEAAPNEEDGKRKAGVGKYCPAESKKRVTDRIMHSIKEDGREMIDAVKEIEEKKMDRLEKILIRVAGVQSPVTQPDGQIEERVLKMEGDIGEMKGTMERILDVLERCG